MQNISKIDEKIEKIEKNLDSSVKVDEIKTENVTIFDNSLDKENLNESSNISGDKLLGELLGYLREKKLMSTLMLCREIRSIEVNDNLAIVYSGDELVKELVTNSKHNEVIVPFFESKGLSLKIVTDNDKGEDIKKLNQILDGKLVVE